MRVREKWKIITWTLHIKKCNSGKIADKFAWCISNTTISLLRSYSIYRWQSFMVFTKWRSWSMIHIYVRFTPYTIPVQTGIPCRKKKDQNKYLVLKHYSAAEKREWMKRKKKELSPCFDSVTRWLFFRSFCRTFDWTITFLCFVEKVSTLFDGKL